MLTEGANTTTNRNGLNEIITINISRYNLTFHLTCHCAACVRESRWCRSIVVGLPVMWFVHERSESVRMLHTTRTARVRWSRRRRRWQKGCICYSDLNELLRALCYACSVNKTNNRGRANQREYCDEFFFRRCCTLAHICSYTLYYCNHNSCNMNVSSEFSIVSIVDIRRFPCKCNCILKTLSYTVRESARAF